jgi:hypothetical protein
MDDLRALQSDTYYGLLKTMQVRDWHFRSLLVRPPPRRWLLPRLAWRAVCSRRPPCGD